MIQTIKYTNPNAFVQDVVEYKIGLVQIDSLNLIVDNGIEVVFNLTAAKLREDSVPLLLQCEFKGVPQFHLHSLVHFLKLKGVMVCMGKWTEAELTEAEDLSQVWAQKKFTLTEKK